MCAVSLGWSGRGCVRLAGDRVRDVRSEGKATLLQAPPFPTTESLRENGWQVDPACGYGHEYMVSDRPNYSHVLGEGVRPRLHEDRNPRFLCTGEIQPKQNPDGLLVALAAGRLVGPNRCSSAIANESISTARRAGVAGTEEKISIVLHTNRHARIR